MSSIAIRLPYNGNYPVTQLFGENPDIYQQFSLPGHNGVDFGLPNGTPVLAAAEGVVKKVGWDEKGYGNYVLLQHNGFQTLYAHLKSVAVKVNTNIFEGDVIGYSDNTGFSTGPHLHFELRIPGASGSYKNGEVNPLQFIRAIENNQSQNSQTATGTYVVTADALNVRKSPSLYAPILGHLNRGDEINVESIEGDWARISAYISTSWIKAK